jgi:hypothetical protein
MFKFMRQVGLALCVGVAVAVGLAVGGYCVARFDVKSLLKGALAALEPANNAGQAVEVVSADQAASDSDPDPLVAKRRDRGPVLRPVVLEEEEVGEEPVEAVVEEFPRLAALPLPVRELTTAALGDASPTPTPVVASVKVGERTYLKADFDKDPKIEPGATVAVTFKEDVGAIEKLTLNEKTAAVATDPKDSKKTFQLTVEPGKQHTLKYDSAVVLSFDTAAKASFGAPVIDQVSNGKYADLVPSGSLKTPIEVMGGYLRTRMQLPTVGEVDFPLFKKEGAEWRYHSTIEKRALGASGLKNGDEFVLRMGGFAAGDYRLFARVRSLGAEAWSKEVDFKAIATALENPVVAQPKQEPEKRYVESNGSFFTRNPELKVSISIPKDTSLKGEVAVFSRDASGVQSVEPVHVFPENEWTKGVATMPLAKAGAQSASANLMFQLFQGETPLGHSTPLKVEYRSVPPSVKQVDASDFENSASGTRIRIQFTDTCPIDEARAILRESYLLEYKGVDALATQPAIQNAVFDAASNSVELTVAKASTPGPYLLTLKSGGLEKFGIKDILENPLDASTTGIGRDATFSLTKRTAPPATTSPVEPPPSESRGITGGRATNVEFNEFVPRKEKGEGFNPSDKVVTRVARLYYFRDAHRVAQIVNRTAMSYNKTNVEMAQQWADRSLRRADEATDSRKALEAKAVRAAQESRAVENALAQAQQALASVRSRQAATATEAEKSEDDLAGLKADEQGLAAAVASPKADEDLQAKQENQKKLEQLRRTISQAERTKTRITQAATADVNEIDRLEKMVNNLLGEAQAKRSAEVLATEASEKAQLAEQRAREEQFRREVAAKTEDPDTFAAGKPESNDPVAQVSVSVIGEGVIQLRGPLKGVNLIRTMINEIDSPVGQVRIALHTVQVNGEHGNRMEPVVAQMQRYIDHSRFLTNQSAQMLRNAVVKVAGRVAEQAQRDCPGGTQLHRDMKYQEAFFGADFIAELRNMDSEFLKTDNKVLSLHSMDTTSLSGALFLMALAKNDVRHAILAEFEAMARGKLPQDEMEYLQASLTGASKREMKRFLPLGQNATFKSLHGFFDAEIGGSDTLSPLQREFIRLAQIFKSRLLAEIELRQRVTERALVEDRYGGAESYQQGIEAQKQVREEARRISIRMRAKVVDQQLLVASAIGEIVRKSASLAEENQQAKDDIRRAIQSTVLDTTGNADVENAAAKSVVAISLEPNSTVEVPVSFINELSDEVVKEITKDVVALARAKQAIDHDGKALENAIRSGVTTLESKYSSTRSRIDIIKGGIAGISRDTAKLTLNGVAFHRALWRIRHVDDILRQFDFLAADKIAKAKNTEDERWADYDAVWNAVSPTLIAFGKTTPESTSDKVPIALTRQIVGILGAAQRCLQGIDDQSKEFVEQAKQVRAALLLSVTDGSDAPFDYGSVAAEWTQLEKQLKAVWDPSGKFAQDLGPSIENVSKSFHDLLDASTEMRAALTRLNSTPRALNNRKFLDMFIDDAEDKLIELVEGTRAHIANVDNYIARIAQALEDDFNTQFYNPAFRCVRETSRTYDVQVGQVETTSILTNNRTFAKVSPQATMEFDLPKRDILVNEAFQSALAAYNDYGALVADPNFLSLAKMYGGIPAAHTYGGGQPGPQIRNVLPGLPSSPDARFLTESENNTPKIGSQLDALVPDPSVYSFETGTGWEARPVIQPDGQAVVFRLRYMYTTNIREPVRADEKHLGRIKRHFIDTDVQSGNYELREVSKYTVALKASRTSRGVPLLEDAPGVGVLFRPLPSQESSLQQNIILSQTVIFPTLFDLMGLRWAPAVADLDSYGVKELEHTVRGRERLLRNHVFGITGDEVDEHLGVTPKNPRFYHSNRRPPEEPCEGDVPPKTCPDHCPPVGVYEGVPLDGQYFPYPGIVPSQQATSVSPIQPVPSSGTSSPGGNPPNQERKKESEPNSGTGEKGGMGPDLGSPSPSNSSFRRPAPSTAIRPVGASGGARPVDLERPVESQRKGLWDRLIPGSRPKNPAAAMPSASPRFDTRSGRPVTQVPPTVPSCKPPVREESPRGAATVAVVTPVSESVEVKKPGWGARLKGLPGKVKGVFTGKKEAATDATTVETGRDETGAR